jgi:hypothetical protein
MQTTHAIRPFFQIAKDLGPSQFVCVYTALDNTWVTAGSWIQFKHDDTTLGGQIKEIYKTKSSIKFVLTNTDTLIVDEPNQKCYYNPKKRELCKSVKIQNPMNHPLDRARIDALRADIKKFSEDDQYTLLRTQYSEQLPIDTWLLQTVVNENFSDNTVMHCLKYIIRYFLHTCRIYIPPNPYPSPEAQADGWLLITHGHDQNNQYFDTLWALALHVIEKPASTDFRTACEIKQHAPVSEDAIAYIIARGYTVEPNDRMGKSPNTDAKQAQHEWKRLTSL